MCFIFKCVWDCVCFMDLINIFVIFSWKKGEHFSIQQIGYTVKSTAVEVVLAAWMWLHSGINAMCGSVRDPLHRRSTCMHTHTHTHRSVMLLLVVKWRYDELSKWQGEGRLMSRCYLSGPMAALQESEGGRGGDHFHLLPLNSQYLVKLSSYFMIIFTLQCENYSSCTKVLVVFFCTRCSPNNEKK